MTSRPHRQPGIVVVVLALLALASCSDDGSSTDDGGAEAATPETSEAQLTTAGTETTPVESNQERSTALETTAVVSSTPSTVESQAATSVALGGEQFTPVTIEVLSRRGGSPTPRGWCAWCTRCG